MYDFILVIHILVCLELVVVILLQVGKGNSLGSIFGGSSQSLFGSQGGNVLTKITTFSAVIFMVTSILLSIIPKGSSIIKDSPNINIQKQSETAPTGSEDEKEEQAQPAQPDKNTSEEKQAQPAVTGTEDGQEKQTQSAQPAQPDKNTGEEKQAQPAQSDENTGEEKQAQPAVTGTEDGQEKRTQSAE